MNYPETEKKKCSICLSIGTEYYILEKEFRSLLNSVSPKMCLKVSENSYTCCECLKKLINAYCFKKLCLENEQKIRLKVTEKVRKINMTEMYPNLSFSIDTNICRICLSIIETESYSDFLTKTEGVSILEMFRVSLPELMMDLTYRPIFCATCTKKLNALYMFIKKCMETENKIKTYQEYSLTNEEETGRICLSLNVTQPLKEAKNVMLTNFEYDCDYCGFKADSLGAMKHHKTLTHQKKCTPHGTDEKKSFMCDICNAYKTNRKCNLTKHIAGHTKKSFKCSLCHFQAGSKIDLRKHGLIHKPEAPVSTYHCPKCSYTSENQRNLSKHLTAHKKKETQIESVKVYNCSLCPFVSTTELGLARHMFSHEFNQRIAYVFHPYGFRKKVVAPQNPGCKCEEENIAVNGGEPAVP